MTKSNPTFQRKLLIFEIVGRNEPTDKIKKPKIYKMKIAAKNSVEAKAKYWKFLKTSVRGKIKRSKGEVLSCKVIHEAEPDKVKSFGMVLATNSKGVSATAYKEYRDLSLVGAISQMYEEMSGRHRLLPPDIKICRVNELKQRELKKNSKVGMISQKKVKWPMIRRLPLVPQQYKVTFSAKKPTTFFH